MDITLTIPDDQAPRVRKVIGKQFGLVDALNRPKNATIADIKRWLADKLRDVVRSYELNEAQEQTKAGVEDLSVS